MTWYRYLHYIYNLGMYFVMWQTPQRSSTSISWGSKVSTWKWNLCTWRYCPPSRCWLQVLCLFFTSRAVLLHHKMSHESIPSSPWWSQLCDAERWVGLLWHGLQMWQHHSTLATSWGRLSCPRGLWWSWTCWTWTEAHCSRGNQTVPGLHWQSHRITVQSLDPFGNRWLQKTNCSRDKLQVYL